MPILLFLQNYKKIIIAIVVAVVVSAFLIQSMRISFLKNKVADMKAEYAMAQLQQYKKLIDAVQAHNDRITEINARTKRTASAISNLKIEGKCIKDESFYITANDIVHRNNDRVRD